jgi:UDP-N-acetylmuramate dehydrogenase
MSTVERLMADGTLARDVPLGPLTTYKAGGPARLFAALDTRDQLSDLVQSGLAAHTRILVLGRGSNLVVADAGFDGLVIRLGGEFLEVRVEGNRVVAGAAAPLPRVARTAVDAGLLGLEFFVGVPGSVGGAVRQNAGCFGVETADRLVYASIMALDSGQMRDDDPVGLQLGYRHSNVSERDLVTSAVFHGDPGDPETGRGLMREITRWRRDHQPGGTLNAGSVFKNPKGTTAGELIDSLGLKGMSVGDVSVSQKHANFFVAGPGATAEDISRLVTLVKDTVFERSGTILEPEIQFVGFES